MRLVTIRAKKKKRKEEGKKERKEGRKEERKTDRQKEERQKETPKFGGENHLHNANTRRALSVSKDVLETDS